MSEESYEERRKTFGKCIHDGDGIDISGTYCFLCKRNPEDNRIDWFEERKDNSDELRNLSNNS